MILDFARNTTASKYKLQHWRSWGGGGGIGGHAIVELPCWSEIIRNTEGLKMYSKEQDMLILMR